MNIGRTIRKFRREKEYTQEDLAVILGVTVSAVSQWEQERTIPDITLVPGICSAFDISADELFGIDPYSKNEKIEGYIVEAERMEERNESPRDVLGFMEEAMIRYPDSMKLASHTAYVLQILAQSSEESADDRRSFADRAASINEKILSCTDDEKLRASARQSLVYYYAEREEFDRAIELANTFDSCYVSREELLYLISQRMRDFRNFQYYKQLFLSQALEKITFPFYDKEGNSYYSDDEMARLYEKQIRICEILYDGDYLLINGMLCNAHGYLTKYYAKCEKYEESLIHLARAAEHAEALHEYLASCVIDRHTLLNGEDVKRFSCLAFREGYDGTISGEGKNHAQSIHNIMSDSSFDPVRNLTEFIEVSRKIECILA